MLVGLHVRLSQPSTTALHNSPPPPSTPAVNNNSQHTVKNDPHQPLARDWPGWGPAQHDCREGVLSPFSAPAAELVLMVMVLCATGGQHPRAWGEGAITDLRSLTPNLCKRPSPPPIFLEWSEMGCPSPLPCTTKQHLRRDPE